METSQSPTTIAEPQIWWIVRGREKSGPHSRSELHQMAGEGTLQAADHLWKEGLQKPVPPASVLGNVPLQTREVPMAADNPYQAPQAALLPEVGVLETAPAQPPSLARLIFARIFLGFAIVGALLTVLITVCALLPDPKPWFVSLRLWSDTFRVAALGYVAYRSILKKGKK